MNIIIKPYKKGSKSAKALRIGLNAAGIGDDYLLVNWGSTTCPFHNPMLNKAECVGRAVDKKLTFTNLHLAGVLTVPVIYSYQDAVAYLSKVPNSVIYCRILLNAKGGKGIVVATKPEDLVYAPMYTIGINDPDRKEYRVHVFNGKVIHVQEKRKRKGVDSNDSVRNLVGGWVFTIQNVNPSVHVKNTSINAIAALGLDFGAVDILQTYDGKGLVLEVNTACGLEGTTITKYVAAIKEYVGGL
jgi:glutathione synthase/RimK-type ligase-like ATP-grasp enzyme